MLFPSDRGCRRLLRRSRFRQQSLSSSTDRVGASARGCCMASRTSRLRRWARCHIPARDAHVHSGVRRSRRNAGESDQCRAALAARRTGGGVVAPHGPRGACSWSSLMRPRSARHSSPNTSLNSSTAGGERAHSGSPCIRSPKAGSINYMHSPYFVAAPCTLLHQDRPNTRTHTPKVHGMPMLCHALLLLIAPEGKPLETAAGTTPRHRSRTPNRLAGCWEPRWPHDESFYSWSLLPSRFMPISPIITNISIRSCTNLHAGREHACLCRCQVSGRGLGPRTPVHGLGAPWGRRFPPSSRRAPKAERRLFGERI